MNAPRKAHAIHGMRRRMNQVSVAATTCGEALSEAARLIGQSIELGGVFALQERALEIIEAVIADQRFIAIEAAVPQFAPGHTQKREPSETPGLLETTRTM